MMHGILSFALLCALVGRARAEDCAGPVVGAVFVTGVVVVGIVLIVWLCLRRKNRTAKDKTTTRGKNADKHTYDNPNFVGDEANTSTHQTQSPQLRKEDQAAFAEKGFSGYVECREVEITPPRQQSSTAQNNARGQRQGQDARFGHLPVNHPLRKAGSRGSLDNSYPAADPELVTVSLRSHDIIGLGFNITGTVSGGIFVSKVLHRGPASESGLITAGDRIMSLTISFENMVYEDALTILSYASPYPVQIELQKAGSVAAADDNTDSAAATAAEAKAVRLHPLFRSQSMDDVNKINSENEIFTPRRTYSEMKKSTPAIRSDFPKRDDDIGGSLKRWEGKESIVREESMRSVELSKASSFTVPDLSFDAGDLMDISGNKNALQKDLVLEDESLGVKALRQSPPHSVSSSEDHALVVTNTEVHFHKADTETVHVDIPEGDVSLNTTGDDPNISTTTTASDNITVIEMSTSKMEDRRSPVDLSLGLNTVDLRIENETSPARKRRSARGSTSSRGSSDEDEQKKARKDDDFKLDISAVAAAVAVAVADEDLSMSPDSLNASDIKLDLQQEVELESDKPDGGAVLHFSDPTDDAKMDAYKDASLSTQREDLHLDDHLTVDVDLSQNGQESEPPKLPDSPPPTQPTFQDEDRVQDVLKDYFSDQPSLLEELGLFAGDGENSEGEAETVTEHVTNDGETVVTTTTITTQRETKVESPDSGFMVTLEDNNKASSSDGSSLSSPASSPSKDVEEPKKGSGSPLIRRQSGGGVAFDITTMEFNDLPQQVPEPPRGDPKGGIAYYVGIDDQQAFPVEELLSRGSDDTQQPSLVRSWGLNEATYPGSGSTSNTTSNTQILTLDNNNETGGKTPVTQVDSGFNGMGDSIETTPVHSPTEKYATTTTTNKTITVVEHKDIQGAYTVHVGDGDEKSHEDSEA